MSPRITKDDIRGVMPPIVTPFTEDEELDLGTFRAELRYYQRFDIGAVLVGAANGEGYTLSPEESGALYQAAVEEVAGTVPVIGGILTTSTRDAVRRARLAADAGVDVLMVTPVNYFRSTSDGLVAYYEGIAAECDVPLMVYNAIPQNPISPEVALRLADIGTVISIKEGAGGNLHQLRAFIRTVGDRVAVAFSQDPLLFAGYAMGSKGSLSGLDTILPGHTTRLCDAVQRGDLETARQLDQELALVFEACGSLDWPAMVKAAITMQGRSVGKARSPYVAPSLEHQDRIRQALDAVGVLQPA